MNVDNGSAEQFCSSVRLAFGKLLIVAAVMMIAVAGCNRKSEVPTITRTAALEPREKAAEASATAEGMAGRASVDTAAAYRSAAPDIAPINAIDIRFVSSPTTIKRGEAFDIVVVMNSAQSV